VFLWGRVNTSSILVHEFH
ncbi:Hypothetical protein EIN_045880, partial [Entamoeba invadens IP1]